MSHYIGGNKFSVFGDFEYDVGGTKKDDYILRAGADGVAYWTDKDDVVSPRAYDHYVGEWFGGGVVVAVWVENGIDKCLVVAPQDASYFYVTQTGYVEDGPFGPMINYLSTFGTTRIVPWSNTSNLITQTTSDSFGLTNSINIVGVAGFNTTIDPVITDGVRSGYSGAAQWALNYVNPNLGTGIYYDWYLPALFEMRAMTTNLVIVNSVLSTYAADNEIRTFDTGSAWQFNPNLHSAAKMTNISGRYWTSTWNRNTANTVETVWCCTVDETMDEHTEQYPFYELRPKSFEGLFPQAKVRPFRIADDTQVPFNYDADWAIITYVFTKENDLDTNTVIISPSIPESSSGYAQNNYERGWIPASAGLTLPSSTTNGLNVTNGTYSIIWHADDQQGLGRETVLLNFAAFRNYYPTQAEMIVDMRAHWFTNAWSPPYVTGDVGRLNTTDPVSVSVRLYKGGTPQMITDTSGKLQWVNNDSTSNLLLTSISRRITARYTSSASSQRVALLKYNLTTKSGMVYFQ